MAEKFLRITMTDGSKWDVPALLIAEDRAKYYAKVDPDTTYKEEFEFTMSDDFQLIDWAANNMDWDDVEKFAVKVADPPKPDFQESWINGEKEIVIK